MFWIKGILIMIASFWLMEAVAWLAHKYVMHGFLWNVHQDHHVITGKFFQKNDWFFLIFAKKRKKPNTSTKDIMLPIIKTIGKFIFS